jgi:hypothetical protein
MRCRQNAKMIISIIQYIIGGAMRTNVKTLKKDVTLYYMEEISSYPVRSALDS